MIDAPPPGVKNRKIRPVVCNQRGVKRGQGKISDLPPAKTADAVFLYNGLQQFLIVEISGILLIVA